MTPAEVRQGLTLIRNYYAKDGKPHPLNDAQWGVYIAGMSNISAGQLEAACHAWMRTSKWFPALSDLIEMIEGPRTDLTAAAHLAWTAVERAIRSAGSYRGVTFTDAALGECVRQVFGSWPSACGWDFDSPGWAIKRQTFLAIYPGISVRSGSEPVTLIGQHPKETPMLVGHVPGLPAPSRHEFEQLQPSRAEAKQLLDGLRERGILVPFGGRS